MKIVSLVGTHVRGQESLENSDRVQPFRSAVDRPLKELLCLFEVLCDDEKM